MLVALVVGHGVVNRGARTVALSTSWDFPAPAAGDVQEEQWADCDAGRRGGTKSELPLPPEVGWDGACAGVEGFDALRCKAIG